MSALRNALKSLADPLPITMLIDYMKLVLICYTYNVYDKGALAPHEKFCLQTSWVHVYFFKIKGLDSGDSDFKDSSL